MALLAIEVWVLVVVDVVVVAAAQFVAHAVASVFNDMHQVLLAEGSECAEHVRLVDAQYFVFELGERKRSMRVGQCLEHDDAVGGGLDAVMVEQLSSFL